MDVDEDSKPNLAALAYSESARSESIEGLEGSVAGDGAKPPIKRRSPIACRRCRRMRSKCIHNKATPPCKSCAEAGLGAEDCVFPVRGQPDNDRDYRHPRMRAEKAAAAKRDGPKPRRDGPDASGARPSGAPAVRLKQTDDWDDIPPLPEIIDAVNLFTRHYFQLGFIPKELFPERLRQDHRSVSVFLLLGILSISARFSPALIKRYESGMKAVDFFMEKASILALDELYEPTLERCQAFYLLSIAQQGSGHKNKSYINMGIATRMAALMQLHREETYSSMQKPTKEMIIQAESARRTLWMLHSQDNLHCGPLSPVSLAAGDITALLPSDEEDFANGREPKSRAALEDTPPARENPGLLTRQDRSLFASLIQAHHYWGTVARRAMSHAKSSKPWELSSDYAVMAHKLSAWEQDLPQDHRWSMYLLKGYKSEGQDLAYLGVTMITKLCNIVLRKAYLQDIISHDTSDRSRAAFFSNMSLELFRNVCDLFEQIDAQFSGRSPDDGVGAQMASFCVYSCGLFAAYLCKYKNICPNRSIAGDAPMMLQRTMSILMESKEVWPLASRWLEALESFSRDPRATAAGLEGSMADGNDGIPRAVNLPSYSPAILAKINRRNPTSEVTKRFILPPPSASPSNTTSRSLPPLASIPHQPHLDQHPHHQMYQPQAPPPPYSASNSGIGMLVQAAFDNTGSSNSQPGPPPQAYYPPQPTVALYPGTDNFENELQFYLSGDQSWTHPPANIYF